MAVLGQLALTALLLGAGLADPEGRPSDKGLQNTAERSADARDKMICKRFVETGSLVKGYRTCKPKWEWERERENLRALNVTASCRLETGC